jgi:GAF domain-containing protein
MDKYEMSKIMLAKALSEFNAETQSLLDQIRGKELRKLRILERDDIQDFDDLVMIASTVTDSAQAYINFVDVDKVVTKATVADLQQRIYSRDESICDLTVFGNNALVVNDCRAENLVKNYKFVANGAIGSYLGVPVLSPNGVTIGTVCATNSTPKRFTEKQISDLHLVANLVSSLLKQSD